MKVTKAQVQKSTRIFIQIFIFYLIDEAKGMLTFLGIKITADKEFKTTIKTFKWRPMPFKKTVVETANAIKLIQTK